MVPKIYETGIIEYEGTETLYIIEQKVKGTELRKVLEVVGDFLRRSSDILGTGVGIYFLHRE